MLNPFEDPENSDVLKERIKLRMEALGLNPSSVAIKADLGRSAVRDILSGKAKHPKHVTLYRIAEALECSAAYLAGEIDTLFWPDDPKKWAALDKRAWDVTGTLEAGVFRRKWSDLAIDEQAYNPIGKIEPVYSEARFPGRPLAMFAMADQSMDELSIVNGDILTVLVDEDELPPLRDGQVVVVLFSPCDIREHELSARQVKVSGGKTHLVTRSAGRAYRPIILASDEPAEGEKATLLTTMGDRVKIIGRVINLSRDFKV
jgi:transcriptional regulator with XRE-family HTH domain